MNCKLCHEKNEKSAADPKMCKECFTGLATYKRLIAMDRAKLTPKNLKHIARFEAMFKHNEEEDGYVPKVYYTEVTARACDMCGETFKTSTDSLSCEKCKRRERAYRALLKAKPDSDRLFTYRKFYAAAEAEGLKVPAPYLKHKKETQ